MAARTVVVTICSNNYLPQAEVFFASVRRFHPEAALVLGLADLRDPALPYPEGVEVLEAASLGIDDFPSLAFGYDVTEFNTAIKPFLLLRMLERGHRHALYFDPDIALFRPLDELLAALEGGASFALTPHLADPPGPGAARTEADVMRTGTFNLGFMAVSQAPETEPALRWWARMLRHGCVDEQHRGLFVDQKYMDLLPGLVDGLRVLRDPGLNAAYWNIDRRPIARGPAGYTAGGRPLGFFHFSGFDARRPDRLSRHRPEPPAAGALAELLADYADRCRAAAAAAPGAPRPYAYGRFASGVPVHGLVRRMFRDKHPTWSGDPFALFERHSRLPHPACRTGVGGEVVTNLMHYRHGQDPALRFAYDLRDPFAVAAYARRFARDAEIDGLHPALWQAAA